MTSIDARDVPADETSQERLAGRGLDYRAVAADGDDFLPFYRAVSRGFLDGEPNEEREGSAPRSYAERAARMIGVYERDAAPGAWPVGTVTSWVSRLTLPGPAGAEAPLPDIDMWAISGVTVAATHRRRGIARAMLEGELRSAAAAGLAVAGLTVTESTIYGRYGFGMAVPVERLRVETKRAGWIGPDADVRLEFVERARLAETIGELHERVRRHRAGNVSGFSLRWARIAGTDPGNDAGTRTRGVIARDAAGAVRGALAFTISDGDDHTKHSLAIHHLVAETPEVRAALWRFALEYDLVGTVTADLQPVDDPLPWLVADPRAVARTVFDHGWLRILDVARVLTARGYAADADVVVRVRDDLGIADGAWRLGIAGGVAEVTPASGEAGIELGVSELSSVIVGGVPLRALAAAGRVTGEANAIAALDVALRADRAPHLSLWY
ncbi:GNAT family N-acetyltransferase [Microbacterium sp. Marseille-Q6965]|uniref:GNAT family N-acetyltransferase n=1 Tax=Microbacterium sp. Marseille-Q6965 TaxID=2965072 RepID=UPI0021B76FFB|nr:GNAT family N-acetyltransferase [Microbacterium sp. Marseille-Q6965]